MFVNPFNSSGNPFAGKNIIKPPEPSESPSSTKKLPENRLPRYLNFNADYTGCGHWRMLWPEQVLNSYRQCVVHSSTMMVTDPKHWHQVKTVRVQRQATPTQQHFLNYIKDKFSSTKLIYEIDDVCFGPDIPQYNPFRDAFSNQATIDRMKSMMSICDEMTVTTPALRDYFLKNTSQKNITVIPNYIPRFWAGNLFNLKDRNKVFDKNKKRPRILYAGSSSHFDIRGKNNHIDDLSHVTDYIISTLNKYQWVFIGGLPYQLREYEASGAVEFHKWTHLLDYPYMLNNLNISAAIVPLHDNIFNRCKSDIKFLEYAAAGIPCICQDLNVYNECKDLFTDSESLARSIHKLTTDKKYYSKICSTNYNRVSKMWLELDCNRSKFLELYKFNYGSHERININKLNGNI